jgi:hypothetical protein
MPRDVFGLVKFFFKKVTVKMKHITSTAKAAASSANSKSVAVRYQAAVLEQQEKIKA